MFKKTMTYTDYFGDEQTQDFYFNLSKLELMELNLSATGGLQRTIERMTETNDAKSIYGLLKDIVLKAYGERSEDGRRFLKSHERSEAFSQTEAFSDLMMELLQDEGAAINFLIGALPSDLAAAAREQLPKPTIISEVSGEPTEIK